MEKVNVKSNFPCKICNKYYASKSSLCNHTKKFHKLNNIMDLPNSLFGSSKSIPNIEDPITCKFCNKKYSSPRNRWKHEQKCKLKVTHKIEKLEEIIVELQTQNQLMKQNIENITNNKNINNKQIINTNNNTNNNITNTNNGKIINNTFVKFGNMEYKKILNNSQIKKILYRQYSSLEESIKQIHFNEDLPEYNNVFITNMNNDIAYVFNGTQFISVRKNEMLNELIDTHIKEINLSLEKNKNKLNEQYVTRLEKFLDMLNDDLPRPIGSKATVSYAHVIRNLLIIIIKEHIIVIKHTCPVRTLSP
jgi:hypothetical protein